MTGLTTGAIHFAMTHSEPGGLREIWNDVAEGLAARGHSVERFVLYPSGGAEQRDHAAAEGWHHLMPRRATGSLAAARVFSELVRYLKRTQPAAVVTAMPFANVIMPLAMRVAGTGTRCYVSHHSPADTHNPKLALIDRLTGRMPTVARIICVSDAVAASFAHAPAAYRTKLVTIHNALPRLVESVIDRLYEAAPGRKIAGRIVALGRLSHQKNYPMLLRAMVHVPDGSLDIVGAGEDEAELRALAQACGIVDRVRFLGWMTRAEALGQAATAQVFVQVSHYEGHSLALVEAARLGLPLVVSAVPVQIEGITDAEGRRCGIAVPIGDDRQLAAVLSNLLADTDARADWASRSRQLGLAASNQAMIDAYERLLAG
jgi:glycosyltransferase involved in cell wall biosynthesis